MMAMGGLTRDAAVKLLPRATARPDEPVGIWTELKDVVTLANLCASQMRVIAGAMGGSAVLGFDRPALDVTAGWIDVRIDRQMTEDLVVIEQEAVRIIDGGRRQ